MGNFQFWSAREPTTVEECDSTWESDSEPEEQQEIVQKAIATDEEARGGGSVEDQAKSRENSSYVNLKFYMKEIPLKPDGVYIDDILTKWKGDYDKLEHNHTYIQWLFPLREPGLNWHAEELTTEEIKEFLKTKTAKHNYLQVYEIMLDFYGMKLEDKNTGTVSRAANWKERFEHLNESQHNYLRITRILKSLGEFKFESFQIHLVHFLLYEALVEETLSNMLHSALEYFVYTIKSRKERRKLLRFACQHYKPPENFVWGPLRKETPGEKSTITKLSFLSEKLSAQEKSRCEAISNGSRTHVAFAAVKELASSTETSPGTGMHQKDQVIDQGNSKAENVAGKNKISVKEKSNHHVTKPKVSTESNIGNQAPQSHTVEDTDLKEK
ncbi:opioid growth factor receptor-like protein 1 isoform X2 [Pristis pectinata]|uniref:opioid growth factor receptor-like protein 1 isoform X2 n=1 Tax=Pristis pectinata TaxID=685728 RepID=UPI00223CDD7B|nr:opioid growth factor receptor-like protein 1 isoform X2 [Pristis pectinata]